MKAYFSGELVYFVRHIRVPRAVKVGWTSDLASRIRSLSTASPYGIEVIGVILGTMELETYIHDILKRERLNGEWFWGKLTEEAVETGSLCDMDLVRPGDKEWFRLRQIDKKLCQK